MSFESQLKAIAAKRGADLVKVARMSVFEVGNKIVLRSPVDTGAFRANWLWSVGTPNTSTTTDTSFAKSLGELNAVLTTFNPDQIGYFTNSLPYAKRLEDGWSEKAKTGMVAISVAEYPAIVRRIVASLR